ncbi:SRPBCC family protein [Brevundimonas staleyi]|uniref:SRPBCC family protein n=1 Tax=Brevundimonas staleyi TaxID=74326 RepID=A0ABW0FRB4_9CAUL
MPTYPAWIVHLSIERPADEVAAFVGDPANMDQWASGLSDGLRPDGEDWIGAGGPLGDIHVRFAPRNDLGVVDHTVTLPDGTEVYNALRVSPNGDGCEVAFTVLRQPTQDDAAFEADAAHVLKDLKTLKALMEAG